MKQADKTFINKIILYKFLFQIYIRIIPLVFSILSGCGITFVQLWRKSDFESGLGYWEFQNILQLPLIVPQLHDFLKEVQNEVLETLSIRFLFLTFLYCYQCISCYDYIIIIILYLHYYLFIIYFFYYLLFYFGET